MKTTNCTCQWCGAALFRTKQSVRVRFHFCDRKCKGEFQRTQKPVTKDWLHQQYIVNGLDCTQIAKIVGRNSKRVWEWLRDYGIPTRKRGATENSWLRKGRPNPFKGRKHTPETRKKMSDAAKAAGRVPYDPAVGSYMKNRRGSNNPKWKGGISPERQAFYASEEWKESSREVKRRDRNTCQRCGKVKVRNDGQQFDIHHIVSFACVELRAVVSNLVFLCEPCHYWVHGSENVDKVFIKEE